MKKLVRIISLLFLAFLFLGLLMPLAERGGLDKAKDKSTKANLVTLRNAVVMFKMDTGRYPSAEKGLRELIEHPADVNGWAPGGYLEEISVPKDAWKNDFIYNQTSDPNQPFVIISYGADGKPGGTGHDTDIYSTELEGRVR